MTGHYLIANWHIASDLRLPGILTTEPTDDVPDVVVRCPSPRMPTTNLFQLSPVLRVGKQGIASFELPSICSCVVMGGRYVGITPCHQVPDGVLRCMLFGSVLAALCHQRLVLPLRGTCITKGNDAVAFIGPPGAGKTALAAGLHRHGWRFQSDGLVLVDTDPTRPGVWFSYIGAMVWKHTMLALEINPTGLERANLDAQRYFLAAARDANCPVSVPLVAIYLAGHGSHDGAPQAVRLPESAAEKQLLSQVVLEQLAQFYDTANFVHQAVRKIATLVPCFTLTRNRHGDLLGQLAPVEELLCEAQA